MTVDGSAVEMYRAMGPDHETVEFLRPLLWPGGTVLDVGAGVGRIADPLCRWGFDVTALDTSADMLAHVQLARTRQDDMSTAVFDSTFDNIIVSAHIIDYAVEDRPAFIAACARALSPRRGRLFIQRQPRSWYEAVRPRVWHDGTRTTEIRDLRWLDEERLAFTMRYEIGGDTWEHGVVSRIFDDARADQMFQEHGLRRLVLDAHHGSWIAATSE